MQVGINLAEVGKIKKETAMDETKLGCYLLFLWMENILTDGEYNRAVERLNKKLAEKREASKEATE